MAFAPFCAITSSMEICKDRMLSAFSELHSYLLKTINTTTNLLKNISPFLSASLEI